MPHAGTCRHDNDNGGCSSCSRNTHINKRPAGAAAGGPPSDHRHGHTDNKEKLKKGLWSPDEDEKLVRYIAMHGHGCWSSVAKRAGLQRCGKSCRLRWINYLRPDLKKGSFSPSEEKLIIQLHAILGNRWSQIATYLPGRTDNEIKNCWHSSLKKKLKNAGTEPKAHQANISVDGHSNYIKAAGGCAFKDTGNLHPTTNPPIKHFLKLEEECNSSIKDCSIGTSWLKKVEVLSRKQFPFSGFEGLQLEFDDQCINDPESSTSVVNNHKEFSINKSSQVGNSTGISTQAVSCLSRYSSPFMVEDSDDHHVHDEGAGIYPLDIVSLETQKLPKLLAMGSSMLSPHPETPFTMINKSSLMMQRPLTEGVCAANGSGIAHEIVTCEWHNHKDRLAILCNTQLDCTLGSYQQSNKYGDNIDNEYSYKHLGSIVSAASSPESQFMVNENEECQTEAQSLIILNKAPGHYDDRAVKHHTGEIFTDAFPIKPGSIECLVASINSEMANSISMNMIGAARPEPIRTVYNVSNVSNIFRCVGEDYQHQPVIGNQFSCSDLNNFAENMVNSSGYNDLKPSVLVEALMQPAEQMNNSMITDIIAAQQSELQNNASDRMFVEEVAADLLWQMPLEHG